MVDIIIIGAGPAGLTAAIYARRAEKSVLVLEKETFGGQITHSPLVENYPGFLQMSGNEFAEKLIEQALNLGAEIELEEALAIETRDGHKVVRTDAGEHEAKAVILAAGAKHRQLGLPGENELIGEGVSYCAVCDGAFYKGKTVAVIGGGNSALQEAVLLSKGCEKVYILQNLAFLTGEQRMIRQIEALENVEIILGTVVTALHGEDKLTAVTLRNEETGSEEELALDGIFVAIGQVPENEHFKDTVRLNDYGYVDADESCTTNAEGVFVAGDCRSKTVRQITTATGDGAVAALAACRYVDAQG